MKRQNFRSTVFADMVALYSEPGVQPLCLSLQQEFDADVPLLLLLALADHAGLGASPAELRELTAFSSDWREIAVRPLRNLRMTLKPMIEEPGVNAFREKIKAVELAAEKLQVEKLADRFATYAGSGGLAMAYLEGLGITPDRVRATVDQLSEALAGGAAKPPSP